MDNKGSYMLKNWKNSDYFCSSLIMIISFVFFSIWACLVNHFQTFNALDLYIVAKIHSFSSVHSIKLAKIITDLGYGLSISMILAISVIILTFYRHNLSAILITLTTVTSPIAILISKNLFARPRPPLEYRLIHATDFSFPSGHSFISICFYGILVYFVFQYMENKFLKYFLIFTLSLLIFSIGFSRVYLGVHYPSDIIGGFALGIFWLSLWITIYKVYRKIFI